MSIIEPKCPCAGCLRRHSKCHASCPDYATYNEQRKEYRRQINIIKGVEAATASSIVKRYRNKGE